MRNDSRAWGEASGPLAKTESSCDTSTCVGVKPTAELKDKEQKPCKAQADGSGSNEAVGFGSAHERAAT